MIALGVSVTGECVQQCVVFVSWSLSVRLREGEVIGRKGERSQCIDTLVPMVHILPGGGR